MLNRRILRIKAMQALYGYFTAQASLKYVIREKLGKSYTPDPLIDDLSDTAEMDANRKVALRLYDENLIAGHLSPKPDIDDDLFETVNAAIREYYDVLRSEKKRIRKDLLERTRNIQDEYLNFLLLPDEFRFLEQQTRDKNESARVKRNDPFKYNLLNNPVITAITTNQELQQEVTKKKLSWQSESEDLKNWYKQIISRDERFEAYQQLDAPSIEDHIAILKHLYKNILFKNETIVDYFEQRNIRWSEDHQVLRSMLIRTIQDYDQENEPAIALKQVSLNEEDDFEFFQTLYDATIEENDNLEKLIADQTKNWDVSRLAQTDRIILKMAIAEMIHCRSIPTKVTINEFIEICKQYSTPKSKQFVNGILDVLANKLTSEGVIKKSGRGLIDNR